MTAAPSTEQQKQKLIEDRHMKERTLSHAKKDQPMS